MLHTNSKKAHENIRKYIITYFIPEGYDEAPKPKKDDKFTLEQFPEIARFIRQVMTVEKPYYNIYGQPIYRNAYSRCADWLQGLPSVLDARYHYNRSALQDVAEILDETWEEADEYTEQKAEQLLDKMIYAELLKGVAESI